MVRRRAFDCRQRRSHSASIQSTRRFLSIYFRQGTSPHTLAEVQDAESAKVRDCRFYPTGLVAFLHSSQLVTTGYNPPQPRLLASPAPHENILSWTIIPPQSSTRHVEVLLATRTTILVADQLEVQDQLLQQGPFTHLALSPNGRFLVLYTMSSGLGRIWVVYSDFQKGISDFTIPGGTSETDGSVRQIGWVANDAVVVSWEGGRVVVIGPTGGYLEYFYNDGVWIVEELDGMRIYSTTTCEFIQKVQGNRSKTRWLISDVSEGVFKVGSSSPSAVLLDAVDQLERNSAKADEDIRLIKSQLSEAVDGCIAAAGYEWDPYWQKQLLKAASFGKAFLELYNSDDFVDMCRILRVLNAIRDYKVGLPISYAQYYCR
jgi:vacuolar protein sorting-associated protein 16